MRKYFCDGCDRELGNGVKVNTVSLTATVNNDEPKSYGVVDLCNGCLSNLQSNINPRNWTRCQKVA